MKHPIRHRLALLLALLFCAASAGAAGNPPPEYPSLPGEAPAHFVPDHSSFGCAIRDAMTPMRAGMPTSSLATSPGIPS